jgi:hypothetical protein
MEEKAAFLAAVQEGLTHDAAFKRVGISRRKVMDWRKADTEFNAAVEATRKM